MGIFNIIILILMISLSIGLIITTIKLWDNNDARVPLIVMCLIMVFVTIVLAITPYKGSLTLYDTVKKIGMEKVEQGLDKGIFTKGNLKVSYDEATYTHSYVITDQKDMNLNNHQRLLDCFFNFGEGTTQMIYSHLVNEAQKTENLAKILIEYNHTKLEVEYDIKTETITYLIDKEIHVDYISTNANGGSERRYNPNYNRLYLIPKLEISHLSDEDYNFDIKLLNLLFNKNAEDFNVEIDDFGYIIYTYKNK